MRPREGQFGVRVWGTNLPQPTELRSGVHFRLDEVQISESLSVPLRDLDYDLFRIAMAVYAVDRLVRRAGATNDRPACRELTLQVPVSDPHFWNEHSESIGGILEFLSDDQWQIQFCSGSKLPNVPPFLFDERNQEPSRVCLYSGGLDSVCGLPIRLNETRERFFALTALHQPHQARRVRRHFQEVSQKFGPRVVSVIARTTLIDPPRMDKQELSQRCRSFLFAAMGGVLASRTGADEIEVFENGVGILNLPPMTGMLWGGRATRGCHPQFFRMMSKLVTSVAGRRIRFSLPFKGWTKAEMVRRVIDFGMHDLMSGAVSCVHYPMRIAGKAKQCGLCAGCLGNRQAVLAAGLTAASDGFEHDILNPQLINELSSEHLAYLRQQLLQVGDLQELVANGSRPQILRRHLNMSGAVTLDDRAEDWARLLGRFRDEWIRVVQMGRERNCHWAEWVSAA